jgi:hypothetical protein
MKRGEKYNARGGSSAWCGGVGARARARWDDYGPGDADDDEDGVAAVSDEGFADLRSRRRSAGGGDGGPARERAPRS